MQSILLPNSIESLRDSIYDPEGRIGNAEGLKRDTNGHNEGFVEVVIDPLMYDRYYKKLGNWYVMDETGGRTLEK